MGAGEEKSYRASYAHGLRSCRMDQSPVPMACHGFEMQSCPHCTPELVCGTGFSAACIAKTHSEWTVLRGAWMREDRKLQSQEVFSVCPGRACAAAATLVTSLESQRASVLK